MWGVVRRGTRCIVRAKHMLQARSVRLQPQHQAPMTLGARATSALLGQTAQWYHSIHT